MLQRRDLLLAGSETFRKTSLLGAPFEPKVSVTVPVKVTASSSSVTVAAVSSPIFTYDGVNYTLDVIAKTKSQIAPIYFGWAASFSREKFPGVVGPCCTVYLMRKDTGAIWAFIPCLVYAKGISSNRPIRWVQNSGPFTGVPINDASYNGTPLSDDYNSLNLRDLFTKADNGKTIECVIEIYSNYINDRPAPTEPQKYRLYLQDQSHILNDTYEYAQAEGGWEHPYDWYKAQGVNSPAGYDTRIGLDDMCCFTYWTDQLFTQPLLCVYARDVNDSGYGQFFFGPTCAPWLGNTSLAVTNAFIYRADQPGTTIPLKLDVGNNQTGSALYNSDDDPNHKVFPISRDERGKIIDLYFQYVSSE